MLRRPGRLCVSTAAATLAVCAVAAVPGGVGAKAPKKPVVHVPTSGKYVGASAGQRKLTVYISGKSVQIVAFDFGCKPGVVGSTSLQSIALKRTDLGYRFAIRTHGIVTYKDPVPDENAEIVVSGRFARSGKTVTGTFRVRSPRCRATSYVAWHAKR